MMFKSGCSNVLSNFASTVSSLTGNLLRYSSFIISNIFLYWGFENIFSLISFIVSLSKNTVESNPLSIPSIIIVSNLSNIIPT